VQSIGYRVTARNPATASENRIHADDVARRYGFEGGLVPGVTVYGYMCHPLVEALGEAWVSSGSASMRFHAPCYEGDELSVLVAPEASVTGSVGVEVWVGTRQCVTGSASRPVAPAAATARSEGPGIPHAETDAERPVASSEVFASGRILGSIPLDTSEEAAAAYLDMIREPSSLYSQNDWIHPGMLIQGANWVLSSNVVMPAWLHVETTVRHLRSLRVGEEVEVRGRIADSFERKGHSFVAVDVSWVAGTDEVATARHTAIWKLAE
jgi:acyl dehydratase